MSDRPDEQLNQPGQDPSYSVEEILSEFSSAREDKRVLSFPDQPEHRPAVDDIPRKRNVSPSKKLIDLPAENPLLGLMERIRGLFRKADAYADQMYQQAEPTPEQLEAERYIPGVDREEFPEEPVKRRTRRKPAAPPQDISPADLAARRKAGLKAARLRILPTLLVALIATYVATGLPLPALGPSEYRLRLLLSLGALALTVLLCIDVIAVGLVQLFTLKPGVETLSALAALVTLADALTMPTLGMRGHTLPCSAPACFVLLFNLWGRYLKRRADYQSCRTASQAREPYLLTLDDAKWSGRPAYSKWSGPLCGFGSQIQSPDCIQTVYRIAAPLLLLVCILCSLLASVGREKGFQFLWSFSTTLIAAASFSAPLAYAIPYSRITRRLGKLGSALAGWPGVERCGPDSLILTDSDLFPTGAAKLNGMKIYEPFPTEKVIGYTATLVRASKSGLNKAFSDLAKSQNALYRPCSGVRFHEGGVTGIIHNQEVIVGTAAFLHLMNIKLPPGIRVKTAVFCAIDGKLAGIFAIHYSIHSDTSPCLSALMRNHISPLLATRDHNLLPSLLRQKFKLPVDRMEFPSIDRRLELSDPEQEHDETITAVLLREGLYPYSDAAIGAFRLRTAARLSSTLSVCGGSAGVLLTFYLTFVDAFHSLSPLAFLVFLFAWLIPTLLLGDWVTRY